MDNEPEAVPAAETPANDAPAVAATAVPEHPALLAEIRQHAADIVNLMARLPAEMRGEFVKLHDAAMAHVG